jgi:quaternary ammonium compound-resistance protein SugE
MASPGESIADGGAMGHFQGGYVAWVVLFVAGLLETGWAVGLKYTEGFTRLWPTLWTVGAIVASLGLLGIAVKTLPVGTAYTVWAGIGAVGTVTVGIFLFGESANPLRLASLALIVAGIVGLRLSAG